MLFLFFVVIKKNLIDTSTIFRYFNASISEILDFSVKIFAETFFVIRYNNVNLNDNKEKRELDISTNDKCSKLVIVSV